MFASSRQLLFASTVLFAALPPAAAEETTNPIAPSVFTRAVVKCPGMTSVPLTADAEQSLPLRVVGTLACGSTVSILSAGEGYTAQIRSVRI